jgi:AcrR family transcriptional regulator
MTVGSPALRVDAERNRRAVVAAASVVFSTQGTDAPLEEVAREAGVGIATLYRRFPSRDLLIEAVFEQRMADYADEAVRAAERARTEPWPALEAYLLYILEQQATEPAFADVLIAPLVGSPIFAAQHRRALAATIELVSLAKAAGVVRVGFDHSDLYLATLANAGLVKSARSSGVEASRRLATYLINSFSATSREAPLPAVPRVWLRAQRG